MLANAVHLFNYHVEVLNFWPACIAFILGIIGFFVCAVAMGLNDPDVFGVFVIGLLIASCIAFPGCLMDWHHTEVRKGAEIQIVVNNQKLWIPAKRLPNGDYWPTTFTRKHK